MVILLCFQIYLLTKILQHHTDVGDCVPFKKHPYCMNAIKTELMQKKVEYLLTNGLPALGLDS